MGRLELLALGWWNLTVPSFRAEPRNEPPSLASRPAPRARLSAAHASHAKAALLVVLVSTLGGCKETTIDDRSCPPEGTKLTYANFGKGFIDANCQTCHGQRSTARNGAPGDYDFASVDDVRAHESRIFARAAADNTTMPPGPDDPPEADREKLAEWLVCGAP